MLSDSSSNNKNNKKRVLMISSPINAETAKCVVESIVEWNLEDDDKDEKEKGFDRNKHPIKLIVNTPGGYVTDGFAIISAIEASVTPVTTCCMGTAMSMGFAIFAAGHHRTAHRLSTFMYHQISDGLWGKIEYIKQELEFSLTLQNLYDDIILKRTNITKERLDEVKKSRGEWYLSADDALKLRLVDELF